MLMIRWEEWNLEVGCINEAEIFFGFSLQEFLFDFDLFRGL